MILADRPAEAGLVGGGIGPDVGAPGAIALFQAQRFDRPIARIGDAMRLARCHQRRVDALTPSIGTCSSQPSSPT